MIYVVGKKRKKIEMTSFYFKLKKEISFEAWDRCSSFVMHEVMYY
jgi:hypothetical protein